MVVTDWPFRASELHLDGPTAAAAGGVAGGHSIAVFAPVDGGLGANWAQPGCVFLFLGPRTDDDAPALSTKLRSYLLAPGHDRVRFLWVENPDAPLAAWRTNALSVVDDRGSTTVAELGYVDIRNYAVVVPKGTTVELSDGTTESGFVFRPPTDSVGFALTIGYGSSRLQTVGPELELAIEGERAGCLRFTLAVDREGTPSEFGYPALARLDVGMRLFMLDPDVPSPPDDPALSSHRYPLIDEYCTNGRAFPHYPQRLWLEVVIDPNQPLVAERSHLTWSGPPGDEGSKIDLPSGYRTNLGHTVHLGPEPDEGRLHFATRPLRPLDPGGPESLYLVPAGRYRISLPDYGQDDQATGELSPRLVCGLSGLEYVAIDPDRTELVFTPGLPALVTGHRSAARLLRNIVTIIGDNTELDIDPADTDLDQAIGPSAATPISDAERRRILDIVGRDHLAPGTRFTDGEIDDYLAIDVLEDLVAWLRDRVWSTGVTWPRTVTGSILDPLATTSWAYPRHPADQQGERPPVVYYAQAEPAVLYQPVAASARPSGGELDLLGYLEIPAVGLPTDLETSQTEALADATGIESVAFPLLPYGGTDRQVLADLARVEANHVAGFRRSRIQRLSEVTAHRSGLGSPATGGEQTGTTAQGLLARFSGDRRTVVDVQLALDAVGKRLALRNLEHGSALKAMLQSNRLFSVISDPTVVADHLTTDLLTIGGWGFDPDPEKWTARGTVLVFKFQDGPLLDLAAEPSSWFEADGFNRGRTAEVSRRLVDHLRRAVTMVRNTDDAKVRRKYRALARAATQSNWTGILAFDIAVSGLPDQLGALAAGIDGDRLTADFLGVEITPVDIDRNADGAVIGLVTEPSSLFAAIDYVDRQIPRANPDGFNFHVLSLSAVFVNSQVVDFGAELVLVVDRLFDEETKLVGGPDGRNLLLLIGTAERHDDTVTYSFSFKGENRFLLSGLALDEVEVVKARFTTDEAEPDSTKVVGRFSLWTRIRFAYRPAFDVLSFGRSPESAGRLNGPGGEVDDEDPDHLSAANLQVVMTFDRNAEDPVSERHFDFVADRLTFDLERSGARRNSLYQRFPLKFTGLLVGGQVGTIERSGFMPVKSPDATIDLGANWYGLTFDLNLGGTGALAGNVGLVVSILAAWAPEENGIYVGLKLPGSSGGKKEIVVQGVFKLVFETIEFVVDSLDARPPSPMIERDVAYLLKLRNLVLKLFVLSVPPTGQTEIVLFGDPRANVARDQKLLGWFASYDRR